MKRCESSACIVVDLYESEGVPGSGLVVRVRSTQTGTTMQATLEEFRVFLQQVKNGEFDELERSHG